MFLDPLVGFRLQTLALDLALDRVESRVGESKALNISKTIMDQLLFMHCFF